MRCPTCFQAKQKSTTYQGILTTTAERYNQYQDNEGRRHDHDPNILKLNYYCTNQHIWTITFIKANCCHQERILNIDFKK